MKKNQNKFILIGTDNDGFRHRYSIEKNEGFKKVFLKFMVKLEFDEGINSMWNSSYEEKDGNKIDVELKVADFEDCIRHHQNPKFDVDVFFGKLRIIIVVRTKTRNSMVKHLEKSAKWIKFLGAKKIKEKNNKKIKLPWQKSRR